MTTQARAWPDLEVGLIGEHQAANAAVAVAAVEALRHGGLSIPDPAIAAGLAGVHWPARMEVVAQRPMVVLDCAHNVASAQALVDTLQTSFTPKTRRLVFAASNDKDLPGMLAVLGPLSPCISNAASAPALSALTPPLATAKQARLMHYTCVRT